MSRSQRVAVVDGTAASLVPSTDRVLTVPNVLSALRLVGVPLFLWLMLGPEADGAAVALLMVSGTTDFLDGKIARHYGLISRVGQLLDPLADRLYVLSTLFAFVVRDVIPLWLALALVVRDLFLAALLPVLRRHGYGPPAVHFLGKAATFNLLSAFPLVLLGAGAGAAADWVRPVGWAFMIWGTALYWWSAGLYTVQVRRLVRTPRAEAAR
jgi:CDP-diacylglycerol--glycerol-3-phosphate 3-phosphatidyltransferase